MSNYRTLPINGESIRGGFQYVDEPHRLSREDNEELAEYLTRAVELGRQAVWFSPAVDHTEAYLEHQPLMLHGRHLRWMPNDEGVIFYPRQHYENAA